MTNASYMALSEHRTKGWETAMCRVVAQTTLDYTYEQLERSLIKIVK